MFSIGTKLQFKTKLPGAVLTTGTITGVVSAEEAGYISDVVQQYAAIVAVPDNVSTVGDLASTQFYVIKIPIAGTTKTARIAVGTDWFSECTVLTAATDVLLLIKNVDTVGQQAVLDMVRAAGYSAIYVTR